MKFALLQLWGTLVGVHYQRGIAKCEACFSCLSSPTSGVTSLRRELLDPAKLGLLPQSKKLAKETHEKQQPQHMHARPHRVAAAVIQLASFGSVA